MRLRIVFEIAETEIGQKRRAERLGHACSQAVIVHNRASGQTAGTKTYSSQSAKTPLAGKAEVVKAIASENLNALAGAEINACVESVLTVRTCPGSQKVESGTTIGAWGIWLREQRKHSGSLRRDPTNRDQIAGEFFPTGSVPGSRKWVVDLSPAITNSVSDIFDSDRRSRECCWSRSSPDCSLIALSRSVPLCYL